MTSEMRLTGSCTQIEAVGKDDDVEKKPAKGAAKKKPAKAAKKADGGDEGEDKPKGKLNFYNRPPPAAVRLH